MSILLPLYRSPPSSLLCSLPLSTLTLYRPPLSSPLPTADTRPSAPASLLRPELRPQAELWKLAYADLLLRARLVGKRAALLQYEFTAVEGHTVAAASGDLPQQELVLASMCRFCNEHVLLPDEVRCQVCARYKEPPLCGVCRLPVKGESKLIRLNF